jgi:hypothetical protein
MNIVDGIELDVENIDNRRHGPQVKGDETESRLRELDMVYPDDDKKESVKLNGGSAFVALSLLLVGFSALVVGTVVLVVILFRTYFK